MGVEVDLKSFGIQKNYKKCCRAGKTVITATQMLESMTNSPNPTSGDNGCCQCCFDGTSAVMLSGKC
ncbi:MAG: pyruvate kinase [Clostridia bacterium]